MKFNYQVPLDTKCAHWISRRRILKSLNVVVEIFQVCLNGHQKAFNRLKNQSMFNVNLIAVHNSFFHRNFIHLSINYLHNEECTIRFIPLRNIN